jgi:hypothetical protein
MEEQEECDPPADSCPLSSALQSPAPGRTTRSLLVHSRHAQLHDVPARNHADARAGASWAPDSTAAAQLLPDAERVLAALDDLQGATSVPA